MPGVADAEAFLSLLASTDHLTFEDVLPLVASDPLDVLTTRDVPSPCPTPRHPSVVLSEEPPKHRPTLESLLSDEGAVLRPRRHADAAAGLNVLLDHSGQADVPHTPGKVEDPVHRLHVKELCLQALISSHTPPPRRRDPPPPRPSPAELAAAIPSERLGLNDIPLHWDVQGETGTGVGRPEPPKTAAQSPRGKDKKKGEAVWDRLHPSPPPKPAEGKSPKHRKGGSPRGKEGSPRRKKGSIRHVLHPSLKPKRSASEKKVRKKSEGKARALRSPSPSASSITSLLSSGAATDPWRRLYKDGVAWCAVRNEWQRQGKQKQAEAEEHAMADVPESNRFRPQINTPRGRRGSSDSKADGAREYRISKQDEKDLLSRLTEDTCAVRFRHSAADTLHEGRCTKHKPEPSFPYAPNTKAFHPGMAVVTRRDPQKASERLYHDAAARELRRHSEKCHAEKIEMWMISKRRDRSLCKPIPREGGGEMDTHWLSPQGSVGSLWEQPAFST